MRILQIISILSGFFLTTVCSAVEQIEVSALLGKKAVLVIDGVQYIVAVGKPTQEGVELVSVEQDGVKLKIDGKTEYYAIGSKQLTSKYSKPKNTEERVYKDGTGMFRTGGSINGTLVSFLVDTGASSVAMNSNIAKRVGINYMLTGKPMRVQTAQGTTKAWSVKLDRLRVGTIELTNIDAAVLEGSYPVEVLLGMSFLGRLNVQHQGELMIMQTKN